MKKLFATAFIVLAAALGITRWTEPDLRSEVPIIYWVIDPAPVRGEHIRLFELWQIKAGHCTEHRLATPADVEAFRARRWSPVIATAIREGNEIGSALLDGTLPADRLPVTIRVPKTETLARKRLYPCGLDYGLPTTLIPAGVDAALASALLGLSCVLQVLPAMCRQGLEPPNWLGAYHWAKPAIMIMGLWSAIGSGNMLLYLAGLSNISPELYDAADIDGASDVSGSGTSPGRNWRRLPSSSRTGGLLPRAYHSSLVQRVRHLPSAAVYDGHPPLAR
ncbi:MAG: hypothetical protein O2923_13025 [Verrucomicrobia bacterium]|nr:hypothetical protein [Verrucomicrobiota bacterium]MDA1088264.1 hypothetical protein [Verrucomicrobiota bacterium]